MNNLLLEVKNLNVDLSGEKVINNLSFNVEQDEILTILGPNGSGKSVLLKVLLGILPYSGEVDWKYEKRIGYLPQGLNQFSTKDMPLSVYDFFKLKDSYFEGDKVVKYLSLIGLSADVLVKNMSSLSGGEFQRVLLAWILIDKPEILILDEPTTGIDLGGGDTIYSLLKKIKEEQKITIILVTHDLNIVYGFSDKVLCLSRKGHTCFGVPREVMSPESLEDVFGMKVKFYEHR